MSKPLSEHEIHQLVNESLDYSVENLDEELVDRLRSGRKRALLGGSSRTWQWQWQWQWQWLSVGAVAGLLLVLVFSWSGEGTSIITDDMYLADEMLQSEESMDLMQELEFYYWLEETQESGELA
jgi:hypothetical protein